jgi:integrase
MRGKTRDRDGVYQRNDRPGWWISFIDGKGRRKRRKIVPPGPETFSGVEARYLAHQKVRLTPAAYERTRGIMECHLKAFFASAKISDIRRSDVQRYITHRSGQVSAGTVAREMNVLKRFFSLCVEWELIVLNPASGVKSPRVPAGRVRYLHPGEFRALLAVCPEWLRPIVGLAVATGMRRGEILGLRLLDVDRRGERIVLPQTKNGEGRIVYLNRLALQVFESVAREDSATVDRVFAHATGRQVSMAFRRAAKAAKIEDFRFHDLRHTAASWLRMEGADIHTIAQLLGHKDLRMAARYQHLSPVFLSDAVKKLDQVFGEKTAIAAA